MILKLMREHAPEWIEAGTILITLILGGVVSAGITFYKVDLMANDVKDIKSTVMMVPVMMERLDHVEEDVKELKSDVKGIQRDIYHVKPVEENWNGS
jgi:hypothetical protein